MKRRRSALCDHSLSVLPRIDEWNLQALKVFRISRGKSCVPRDRNPRNLRIAQVHVAPHFLTGSGQSSRLVCGCGIKVGDSILKFLAHQTAQRGVQAR